MSFSWKEYFDLADELAQIQNPLTSSDEARLRSAISRAYYGAFISARNFLHFRENNPVPHRMNAHWYVMHEFLSSNQAVRVRIGTNLSRLRPDRNMADYDNTFPNLTFIVQKALSRTQEVFDDLDYLANLPSTSSPGAQPP